MKSFKNMMLRYYLMMAVIIVAGFTGQWWLALLGLPIFLMAIMGVGLGSGKESTEAKVRQLEPTMTEELNKKVS